MDVTKCKALKAELAIQPEPQLVAIDRFFDGNDDVGSLGCNLAPHPGIARFQQVLTGLLARTDVEAVYAQISELDPGDGNWPFADTVIVIGSIPAEDLLAAVDELQPDEAGEPEELMVPSEITSRHGHGCPIHVLWWD